MYLQCGPQIWGGIFLRRFVSASGRLGCLGGEGQLRNNLQSIYRQIHVDFRTKIAYKSGETFLGNKWKVSNQEQGGGVGRGAKYEKWEWDKSCLKGEGLILLIRVFFSCTLNS